MAGGLLCLSSHFILLVLLSYSLRPVTKPKNRLLSVDSLFLALNLDSKVFSGRNIGIRRKVRDTGLPPCLKAKAGLFVSEIGMSSLFLVILSGDISVNPGPHSPSSADNEVVSGNSSFVSLSSEDNSLSEYSTSTSTDPFTDQLDSSSDDDYEGAHKYFDIGLGSKGLRFGTWNVDGLSLAKFEQIRPFMLDKFHRPQIDILSINESALKPKIPDSLYSVPGFDIHRRDRKGNKKKGGVLVYVNRELRHKRRSDLEDSNIEVVWLEVYPFKSNRPLLFGGVYRPPAYLKQDDERLEKNIECANLLNLETILAGDTNINYLAIPSFKKHRLVRALRSMNFHQLVTVVTRPISKTCLDHVFTNYPQRISFVGAHTCGLSDHLPVFAVRKYARENGGPRKSIQSIRYRDTKRLNEEQFKQSIREAPWDASFVFDDMDDVVHAWEKTFNTILESHCPWREKRVKRETQPPWMSKAVLKQLYSTDHLLKMARRTGNQDDWANYRAARNKAVSTLLAAKREFYSKSFEENKNNTSAIWKCIKTLTGSCKNNGGINKLEMDGRIIENSKDITEQFNAYFSTIADKLRRTMTKAPFCLSKLLNYVESRKDPDVLFSVPAITSVQVARIIMKISPNKASGIDKISSRLLRIAAPAIAPSVAKLINLSLSTGTFPQRWKTAKVTPLLKKGDRADPNNYRPISVLPVLSKVIERHIHDSLYTYLSDNNLLYSRQSGFRKHHSTEIALIKIIDEILFNLDNNKVSGVVLVDYTKAFDLVDHELLLQKLKVYGIVDKELDWCHSYLSNRRQVVQLDGEVSSERHMAHGVPQGSILGPLFFLLFINDLPLHVSMQVDLYADDTTVSVAADVTKLHLLNDSLNASPGEIESWANANKLLLNEKKTKVLTITGKRLATKADEELCVKTGNGATALDNVSSATLLGLDIDSKLSFHEHVEKNCKKVASRIAILRRIRSFLPLAQRKQYYNALIQPIINYGSAVWSVCDKEYIYRILKLQKRAARVILFADQRASSVELFNRLGWIPVYEQFKINKCAIVHKRIHGNVPIFLSEQLVLNNYFNKRSSRYSDFNLRCPKFIRETESGRTFSVSAARLWNSLPLTTRRIEQPKAFKKSLRDRAFSEQRFLNHFIV